MKAGITGTQNKVDELKLKISPGIELVELKNTDLWQLPNLGLDAFIDLNFDDNTDHLHHYLHIDFPVLLSAAKTQLAKELAGVKTAARLFGFNALPTFINRPLLEASYYNETHKTLLETLAPQLGWQCTWVNDRVGMVTPRIVLMIINEAYYTAQEGTAGKEDIDTGMKLGTNYPFGPFEWAQKIGISNVYEVLDAIYTDTRDERYKICPLLKTEVYKAV